jgi:2-C-methyl-D-erythritol 4-phosphate cytidylyltransferase / 2-C-methyl-D-erythritol 2,4-cyclodiphosphate synthase
MPVGVVIVAAGRGERFGGGLPKQLRHLGGRSLLQRSVAVFERRTDVEALVVVLPPELVADGPALVGSPSRPCRFVAGGLRRQDSVRLGVEALPAEIDVVLIHDAARPFADDALVERVIRGVGDVGAAVPALAARDTVKRRRPGTSVVAETIPRTEIWLAQTPQGFRRAIIEEAVALGMDDESVTDEAMLAEQLGHPVAIVEGSERNVKITTAGDMAAAQAALESAPRVGTGYDLHRLVERRPLVLGGVIVPFDKGPLGHSDGDVLCHALVDAILGGAGAGDIGRHFPDTDPRWKGVAGLELLGRARAIAGEAGWRPTSVDLTVVLERPKLAPYVDEIRDRLAGALELTRNQIGLKAKTNEGVDAVGRGEAIAAHAVAVLMPGTAP